MDWKDIAKGYDAPPEDLQQPLNIQRCTMKVVFEMNLAALCVSVRCSRGDFYRWQWKWGENALLCGSSCLLTPNNVGKHKLRMKWLKTGAQPPSETPQASPPRLVLTLLIAAGFWGKKEAENVSVFVCFKSRPVLLQIHKKQHFFPSFFFISCSTSASTRNSHGWWYFMQPSPGLFGPFRQLHPPTVKE